MQILKTMKRLTAFMLLIFALAGCGYQNSATQPNMLSKGFTKVSFGKVKNPTLDRWLEPAMRSQIRDEITNRGQLQWVDKAEAEALINLKIISLEDSNGIRGDKDETLKYEETLRVQMSITNPNDGRTIWNSGTVEVSESYLPNNEPATQQLVVKLMSRRLVDRLNQAY
jgi:outer membrane lipopolysaccharide assembly protein LptE/RlpB